MLLAVKHAGHHLHLRCAAGGGMVTTMVAYTHPKNEWPTMFGKYVAPQFATLRELQVGWAEG